MNPGPAVPKRLNCCGGGQFGAAYREAQTVAGHGVDEAGGVTREQQAVERGITYVDGQRSENDGRADEPRPGCAIAQQRIVGQHLGQQRRGITSVESPAKDGFTKQTLVRPPGTAATPI